MKKWEENVRKVVPYVPGEQSDSPDMIKLNANENPYPPSPALRRALENMKLENLRLYPEVTMKSLVGTLAAYHGVNADQVFVGVGSDDVIAMCFQTFFNSEKPILFPNISYSFYPVWAELFGVPYETPELDDEFRIVKEDYYRENGGIIFPNPNAPTSLLLEAGDVEDIAAHNQDVVVIVDEAYIDFAEGPTALELVKRYDNLLVTRTFSKSRSMAGMRIGYAIGSPKLIRYLNDVKFSFNSYTMNQAALDMGEASVKDEEYFRETVGKVKATRERSCRRLTELGFVYPKSSANFIFATHPKYEAAEIFEKLKERNIYVRYFKKPRIDRYLRITVGTDDQMDRLFEALEEIVKGEKE